MHLNRQGARIVLGLAALGLCALGANARANDPPDPIAWTPGLIQAVNVIFGARSGWSWSNPPDPVVPTLEATVVPVDGMLQVVNVSHPAESDPGLILPCVKVLIDTDVTGVTTFTLQVDPEMVADHVQVTDLQGTPYAIVPTIPLDLGGE